MEGATAIGDIFYQENDSHQLSPLVVDDETKRRWLVGVQLTMVMKYVGVQRDLEPGLAKKLARFVCENYADLSLNEIEHAFDLLIVKKYEHVSEEYQEEIAEHFQSFDTKYLAKVLNLYREHRGNVMLRAKDLLDVPAEPTVDELEEQHQTWLGLMQSWYEAFHQSGQVLDLPEVLAATFYDFLDIGGQAELSEEEEAEAQARAKNALALRLSYKADRTSKYAKAELRKIYTQLDEVQHEGYTVSHSTMELRTARCLVLWNRFSEKKADFANIVSQADKVARTTEHFKHLSHGN